MLAARQIQPPKKVPKLLNSRVQIVPSENGKTSMAGRQQIATVNGSGSFNPRWKSFVTAGSIVFPTFFENPLSPLALNKYKDVVFKYTDGQYTFQSYHAEVLAMHKAGIADHLMLPEATIVTRCRKWRVSSKLVVSE